jgi:hypothetical protein
MEFDDEDDLYAPEDPVALPPASGPAPTATSNTEPRRDDLEEGEEEDEGGEMDEGGDSVCFLLYVLAALKPWTDRRASPPGHGSCD